MPLHLVCPCGHSVPYPEESGNYVCTRCKRKLTVTWFAGPLAFESWHAWMLSRAFLSHAERGSVKFIVTSQQNTPAVL